MPALLTGFGARCGKIKRYNIAPQKIIKLDPDVVDETIYSI